MTRIPDNGLIGVRVGVYHILSPLGAGGMGEVYRARDTRLSRDVALKMLPPDFTADPDRIARFEREARTLAALNHPNIGAIYDIEDLEPGTGTDRGNVRALVLELVEGDTLAERIRECAERTGAGLPANEALTIARQIADALDAAHEKGIVHRDLKPANIKITPEGVVKVLDFGLAKLVPAVELSSTTTTTAGGRTREGLMLGTAAYMSPEQARGQTVDRRTDIWAFGCVLYEMLTGYAAFHGGFQRIQHILGLARLADENPHVFISNCGRILRDELRRKHGDRGAPRQLRDVDRADRRGVITRAASDQIQMVRALHLFDDFLDIRAAVQ